MSPFKNAAKTFYIYIVKYLIIALDSGSLDSELFFNNLEKNKIKKYLLLRSASIYATNNPKWNMKTLLLKSTNVEFTGFDMDTSNKIKEIFYNYIHTSNDNFGRFFDNNSRFTGDKSKIFHHYFREIMRYSEEIMIPSTMRMGKKNKVNQNDSRTLNNVTKTPRKKKYESKTTRCFYEEIFKTNQKQLDPFLKMLALEFIQ